MPFHFICIDRMNFSAKQRPSAHELLKSLPAKVEDESISEVLKVLSNRDTAKHAELMKLLFGQVKQILSCSCCLRTRKEHMDWARLKLSFANRSSTLYSNRE